MVDVRQVKEKWKNLSIYCEYSGIEKEIDLPIWELTIEADDNV